MFYPGVNLLSGGIDTESVSKLRYLGEVRSLIKVLSSQVKGHFILIDQCL